MLLSSLSSIIISVITIAAVNFRIFYGNYRCYNSIIIPFVVVVVVFIVVGVAVIIIVIIFVRRLCFHRRWFVCLSVCLSVSKISQKLWTDFDEIFRKCQKCNKEQLIRFW